MKASGWFQWQVTESLVQESSLIFLPNFISRPGRGAGGPSCLPRYPPRSLSRSAAPPPAHPSSPAPARFPSFPPRLLCHCPPEVPATRGGGPWSQPPPLPPLTPLWSPAIARSPTLHSPEHLVVHGLEGPCGRHGGGEPSAEKPERGSGRGDCGGREREGAHGTVWRPPRLSSVPDAGAPGSRVGRRQMRLRGVGARTATHGRGKRPLAPRASVPCPASGGAGPASGRGSPAARSLRFNAHFRMFVNTSRRLFQHFTSSVPQNDSF